MKLYLQKTFPFFQIESDIDYINISIFGNILSCYQNIKTNKYLWKNHSHCYDTLLKFVIVIWYRKILFP